MPKKDSIVEEVHAVRETLVRDAGYDLDRLVEAAKARQAAGGRRAVTLPPKKAISPRKAS